jgi:hypothetical protein
MLRGQVAGLGGAVQLDGFVLEVGFFSPQLWPYIGLGLEWGFLGRCMLIMVDVAGLRTFRQSLQELVQHESRT